jgi:hypothetical protein
MLALPIMPIVTFPIQTPALWLTWPRPGPGSGTTAEPALPRMPR